MTELERAVKNGGCFAFTMQYRPDFPITFLCGENPFSDSETVLLGDIIYADDYQPFCDIIGDIVAKKSDCIKAHARLRSDGQYRWYYISAAAERDGDKTLRRICGTMFDVTEYLDCEGEDAVLRSFRSKVEASMATMDNVPKLSDILGTDYLTDIQQPFTHIKGLFSQIMDENGRVIASAQGQDKGANLNKMSYQRKKGIRIKHRTAGFWTIAGENPDSINESVPLLDTMVKTVSEIANSYIVIYEEMENSRRANKLLGQNFEDQILVNNVSSLILQGKSAADSFKNIIPLITEYFSLEDIVFCDTGSHPAKSYRWDASGNLYPIVSDNSKNLHIEKELEFSEVLCVSEDEIYDERTRNRSMALANIYENGASKGVVAFIARDSGKEWSNRDRKVIRNITQLLSAVINRIFIENELARSQEHLHRLAYYNTETGIPNRSAFERDFAQALAKQQSGAVVAAEISNLKSLSESYSTQYASEIVRSIAEYISAVPSGSSKTIYRFSPDTLYVALPGADRDTAVKFAETILSKFKTPWFLNDSETKLNIHAGVVMFPDNAEDAGECIKFAARTIRCAKEKNLHEALCYSDSVEEELGDDKRLRKQIIESAENGFRDFYFLYTPVVDACSGELVCCEAHLFWSDGEVIIARDKYLPIINRLGMAKQIYSFVTSRLCEFCTAVRECGIPQFRVSFAIPEDILNLDEGVLLLRKSLLEYSLPPDAISISVSENDNTLLTHNQSLKQLATVGVNIIADDKGGKFFSDAILENPFVKLIKLRAKRLSDDPVSAAFVKSVIDRAHEKGITVCIKGVDNADALENARGFNADLVQGFISGRPLHTSDFMKKLVTKSSVGDNK